MPALCISTNLSSSDAAAWASFAATLLGSGFTLLAVVFGVRGVKMQIRATDALRERQTSDDETRALALCAQAGRDVQTWITVLASQTNDRNVRELLKRQFALAEGMLDRCLGMQLPIAAIREVVLLRGWTNFHLTWLSSESPRLPTANELALQLMAVGQTIGRIDNLLPEGLRLKKPDPPVS